MIVCILRGVFLHRSVLVAAEAGTDNARPVVNGPLDAEGNSRIGTRTPITEDLDGHDLRAPGNACHAGAVVAGGGGYPGCVCAMTEVVRRVVIVVHEIVARDYLTL